VFDFTHEGWELEKEFSFEASHQLPHHDGKCARLHGHSWKGRILVASDRLHHAGPKQGMVMDYADIGGPVKALVEAKLDHYHLNDSTGLENPTSEELARWIYDQLISSIPTMHAVVIEETCTSRCTYQRYLA
jgi:6-pyruvoyltetrahydropterin/6-carboxytetrahydropterin synthase